LSIFAEGIICKMIEEDYAIHTNNFNFTVFIVPVFGTFFKGAVA
jgi:hypothetical protein